TKTCFLKVIASTSIRKLDCVSFFLRKRKGELLRHIELRLRDRKPLAGAPGTPKDRRGAFLRKRKGCDPQTKKLPTRMSEEFLRYDDPLWGDHGHSIFA